MGFVSIAALVGVVFLAWRVGQTMGRVDVLETRLRDLQETLKTRRQALNIQTNRIDALTARLDALSARIGPLERTFQDAGNLFLKGC